MNILLACLQSPFDYPISGYRFWETYFKEGIREAGHDWIEVPGIDWAFPLSTADADRHASWRTDTWTRMLTEVRKTLETRRIDLFLGYLYPQMVETTAIAALRNLGIPCVNFFCDNLRIFQEIPESLRCFDLHWVPELRALPLYEKVGQKALHLPMPCWVPHSLRTIPTSEESCVLFVGSADEARRRLLGEAIRLGADITIAGEGWHDDGRSSHNATRKDLASTLANQAAFVGRHGLTGFARKLARRALPSASPPIPAHALRGKLPAGIYADAIRNSIVTIGINRIDTFDRSLTAPLKFSRLRDIEAPMMGACYLTEWTDDIGVFYEIGRDVEIYRDAEELAEKISDLRSDPPQRMRLRSSGQTRTLNELCVARSIAKIAQNLGLPSR